VVCPEGLLALRIFEARYLDMVRACLRNNSPFGIVTTLPEGETDVGGNFPFSAVGTSVVIIDADVETVGLIMIRCLGQQRIKIESFTQRPDGLVIGEVTDIPNDIEMAIPDDLMGASTDLVRLLESLPEQGIAAENIPIAKPYKLNDVTWVANRWIELMNIPLLDKQRLMQIDSPLVRLELVQDILDNHSRQIG